MNMKLWIAGQEIDKGIAEENPCDNCGSDMKFRPKYVVDEEAGEVLSYRAFAICTNPECLMEIEF